MNNLLMSNAAAAITHSASSAIEELHDAFAAAGANMIDYTSPEGYDFTDSKALREGKFLGLPLDATNEDDLTEGRVKKWTEQLVTEGMKSA